MLMHVLNLPVESAHGEHTRVCHVEECTSQFATEDSMGFSVGISHYHKAKGHSYMQVHEDQHTCSHAHALDAIHDRIDAHGCMVPGQYRAEVLNPRSTAPDALVRNAVEYHDSPRAFASLPKVCAIATCGKQLTTDVYAPHVDYARPGDGYAGQCYQAVLQQANGGIGSLEQYELACCSLDHAVQAAHALVDEVLARMPHAEIAKSADVPSVNEAMAETDTALPAVSLRKKVKGE